MKGARSVQLGVICIVGIVPHKILSVSTALCRRLDFRHEDLVSRCLNILYGPETDPFAISRAIKNLNGLDPCCPCAEIRNLKIYGRDGRSHSVICKVGLCNSSFGSDICLRFELFHENISSEDSFEAHDRTNEEQSGEQMLCSHGSFKETDHWFSDLEQANMLLDAVSIVDRGLSRHEMIHPYSTMTEISSGTLVITTNAPHLILGPAKAVCTLLGFAEAEVVLRSVGVFYGPESNPRTISSAIKLMLLAHNAHYTSVIPALTLYSRDGAPHVFRAVCSRLPSGGGGSVDCVGACRLRLERQSSDAGPTTPSPPSPLHRPALPAWLWSIPHARAVPAQ